MGTCLSGIVAWIKEKLAGDVILEIKTKPTRGNKIADESTSEIVRIIGKSVKLRKVGRNWVGKCPFHGDTGPSMVVRPDSGYFKCFGCDKQGDAATFVYELARLDGDVV